MVGCSLFSISVFTLASFQFSEVCTIRTSLRCNECSHHIAHSGHLGNESTTLSKFNFGVHSSSCVGGPLYHGMPLSSWFFIHHYPGILFASLMCSVFCFLYPITLCLLKAPGSLSTQSTTVTGLSGWAKHYFSHPLSCNWDSVLFSHEFLIVPESPSPLLERDILSKVQASVFMNMEPALFNWIRCKS